MSVFLWIAQAALAALFVSVGVMKLAMRREPLSAAFAWIEQFSGPQIKGIGLLEATVGLGLVVPAAVNIAPSLTAWAALGGLALVIGGTALHVRRREIPVAAINILFFAGLVAVVWGRFGPYRF